MRFAAWLALLLGVAVLGMWLNSFISGGVPELTTAPVAIAFHLTAEGIMVGVLIVAGVGLFGRRRWAVPLFYLGAGMLVYSGINSPGYFAGQGAWGIVAVFAGVLVLAVLAVSAVAGSRREA